MQVDIDTSGSTTIIKLIGRLKGSPSAEIRDQIAAQVAPDRDLVLDFSAVEGVSNEALRSLLLFLRYVHTHGASISARGIPQELWDAADAAGFLKLFDQAPDSPAMPLFDSPVNRIDVYPTEHHSGFALRVGAPWPLGVTLHGRGVNFAVFSHNAEACTLVLFRQGADEPFAEIPFPADYRIGDVFAMTVFDLDLEEVEYGFRLDGPHDPTAGHRFDPSKLLLDPAATSLVGRETWGQPLANGHGGKLRSRAVPEDFDWEGTRPLRIPMEELVVYETHVRGFTCSPTSRTKFPGSFAGLREKIPYLRDLGVNCVELMPIFEFDELENPRSNPLTGEKLYNYWGYDTIGFFSPKAGYAATGKFGLQVDEFKNLVKELHRAGIEVILDVVFNHTGEGNENGPTLSFRGLDNKIYYMLRPDGSYYNFSGCGNTVNCNHPVVRQFVLDCLRYWVAEFHIDGFRFDLASILGRDVNGQPLANPPLLESLAMDPVLQGTKLIAEAWDAAGLYQVGSFPDYGRWAEWNGKFRDCMRKFLKGDSGQICEVAQRLMGSPDLYSVRGPTASVNFITCHDGFTLADLVSYNQKHNEANGEDNRDGTNGNHSWNCGVEGPSDDPAINSLRRQQVRNALVMLMISRGVPMLLMGDECGRSQSGNNNTYCHDGAINWLDWQQVERNQSLVRFCRNLIRFRQAHRLGDAIDTNDVAWHGTRLFSPDWSNNSRAIGLQLRNLTTSVQSVYIILNMFWEPLDFELPPADTAESWHRFVDTAADAPEDICNLGEEQPLANQQSLRVAGRSSSILVLR